MPDTLAALTAALDEVGVSIGDVCAGSSEHAPHLDVEARGKPEARMVLVVTTYARNAAGRRYLSTNSNSAATEVRRFVIAGDLHLIPATPTQPEGDTYG